jgi:hypothetical protein
MTLTRFRKRLIYKRPPSRILNEPPGPWPVDPKLSRRVIETTRRLGHTRRQLEHDVLPERRHGEGKARARTRSPASPTSPAKVVYRLGLYP